MGNGLVLRAQAWRTSQGVVGGTLFWLVAVLAAMTTWMLIANWRQSQRRQQAQQALMAETTFRRAMENSMLTGMRALDMQGRIIYVNPAFCQMTGWTEDELIGQTEPFSYWPDEDREALAARLSDELIGSSDPAGFQMRVKRRDGTLFDARFYVSPLIDATGKQTGWMASMTDITEPNRVRRQLSASYERFTTVLEALDARGHTQGAAVRRKPGHRGRLCRLAAGRLGHGPRHRPCRGLYRAPGQVAGSAHALPQLGGRAAGANGDCHRHHRPPPCR